MTRSRARTDPTIAIDDCRAERLGVLILLINVPLTALYPVLGKAGSSMVPPLIFASLTALTASCVLGFFQGRTALAFFRARGLRALWALWPVGFWSTGMASLAFFYGIAHTTGSNAAILLQVEPVYAVLLGWLYLAERPGGRQLAGTAVILSGAVVIVWDGGFSPSPGDLLILATPLFWQLGNMKARKSLLEGVPTGVVTLSRLVVGSVILVAAAVFSGLRFDDIPADGGFWASVAAVGALCMALCYSLWYQGLSRVPIGKATSIIAACPVVAVLLAWALLGEVPAFRQFLGLAVVLTGLLVLSPPERRKPVPSP